MDGNTTTQIIEWQFRQAVDRPMCSLFCQCDEASIDPWKAQSDSYHREYTRTFFPTPQEVIDYGRRQENATVIPYQFTIDDNEIQRSYEECFFNKILPLLQKKFCKNKALFSNNRMYLKYLFAKMNLDFGNR